MNQSYEEIKNITVDEFTTPCPKSVSPDTSLDKLEKILKKEDIRHIPVQEQGKVVGLISQRDLLSAQGKENKSELSAQDIMKKDPYMVDSTTKLSEVAFYMAKHKYGSALVREPDGELGIFTSTDALNALVEVLRGDIISQS